MYNLYMRRTFAAILFSGLVWSQTPPDAPDISKLKTQIERSQRILKDWPNLARYHDENASLAAPAFGENRAVFMCDWITDAWGRRYGKSFPATPYLTPRLTTQTP